MRVLICVCLALTICTTFACMFMPAEDKFNPETQVGEKMGQETSELSGAKYAKLNSVGCYNIPDMQIVADHRNDFDTIDKLIREKKCFVLPTDTDIFIKERARGEIVSAKLRGSTQVFYTITSYLGPK